MRLVCFTVTLLLSGVAASGLVECDSNDDCKPSTATCIHNLCQCSKNEVLNQDGSKCLTLTKVINAKCESEEQCSIFGGPVGCRGGFCKCPEDHVYFRRRCIRKLRNDATCTTQDECFDGLDYHARECDKGKCQCAPGYYNRDGVDCRRKAAMNATCSINLDCQQEDAICSAKKCSLRPEMGFVQYSPHEPEQNTDYAFETLPNAGIALNEACSLGDECQDHHAICSPITRTCSCRNGYLEKSKKCLAELGMLCEIDTDCLPSPGASCSKHICSCAVGMHFDATNSKCRMAAYQDGDVLRCNNVDSCRFLHSYFYCDPEMKTCRCGHGHSLDANFLCLVSCRSDDDCSTLVEHQICNEDNKCVCDEAYELMDGLCQPRIDGVCLDSAQCQAVIAFSHCSKQKLCVCNSGFVAHNHDCYPEVGVDHKCVIDEQCAWKWNSSCTDNGTTQNKLKTCQCNDGFLNVGGNCLRLASHIGDYCSHPAVCMRDSTCERSKCTCLVGWKPSKDGKRCVAQPTSNHKSHSACLRASDVTTLVFLIGATVLI